MWGKDLISNFFSKTNKDDNIHKIVSKFVEKLLKNRIIIKDILIFFGIDYRDDSFTYNIYFIVLGISFPEIRSIGLSYHIKICFKIVKNHHILNGRTDILVTIIEMLRFS